MTTLCFLFKSDNPVHIHLKLEVRRKALTISKDQTREFDLDVISIFSQLPTPKLNLR